MNLQRSELVKKLQTCKKYEEYTQKQISNQFSDIIYLRKELIKLENQDKISSKFQANEHTNSYFPNDVLKEILLHSDLKTIVNVCSTNKYNQQLCDKEFWTFKLIHDKLPLLDNNPHRLQYYRNIINAKCNAKYMIEIVETFNKYKGNGMIILGYHDDYIHPLITNHFSHDIIFTYYNKSNHWTVDGTVISYIDLLTVLTDEIYYSEYADKHINFYDYDRNELLYFNLLLRAKQNKVMPRAYLMAYELLMNK